MLIKKRTLILLLIMSILGLGYVNSRIINSNVLAANSNIILGDVNSDETVNMKDIVLLQQYMNAWDVTINDECADVNLDSVINMKDIVMLQQYMNNIVDLPELEVMPELQYTAFVQGDGWTKNACDGEIIGVAGEKALENIVINLPGVQYRSYLSDNGWEDWKSSGDISGSFTGDNVIEAIQIKLDENDSSKYDICYRMYVEKYGWLGWAKDGESSGSVGIALQAQAIQIKLSEKGENTDTDNIACLTNPSLTYKAHVQDVYWQSRVGEGEIAGTMGQSLRLEALKINLSDFDGNAAIQYKAHVSDIGWQSWVSSGEVAGTEGKEKPIEAIRIKLSSALESYFDIYYRVHVESVGWLGWAKNGENSGSTGMRLDVEAIQVKLVNKNEVLESEMTAYLTKPSLTYKAHVQDIGWQDRVSEGSIAGTESESLRLEAFKVNLNDFDGNAAIQYRAHVSDIGWQSWVSSGEVAGTEGEEKPVEAIRIRLLSSLEGVFDVYYRVHAEDYGWLGWAKNGENAGTIGGRKQIEAIEVRLINKGQEAPGGGTAFYELSEDNSNTLLSPVPAGCLFNTQTTDNGWYGYHDININVSTSTPVYAIADGTVAFKQAYTIINGVQKLTSYGNFIEFTSSDGVYTAKYCHLNAFVGVNQIISSSNTVQQKGNTGTHVLGSRNVKRGEILGYIGTTGNSSGIHLHFELRKNGTRINPTTVFPELKK